MKLPLKLLVIILLVLVVVGAGYFLINRKEIENKSSVEYSEKKIVKVGNEKIYDIDFKYQYSLIPSHIDEGEARKIVEERIIKESIILQAGEKEGLIKLDSNIFNSESKDYKERQQAIQQVQQAIDKKAAKLQGKIVSIWFLNNKVGPLGYDKAKQIAYEKITKLQQEVKSGNLTIDAASVRIKNDSSLFQLDPMYKSNAIYSFSATQNQKPSYNDNFNNALWELGEGDTSEVFALQSQDFDDNYKIKDAYYSFGQITKKTQGQIVNFDSWYMNNKENFQVIYE